MSVLTDSGRAAIAKAIAAQPIYLAWGNGLPAWDATPPTETTGISALISEVGRRVVTQSLYVTPAANGAISVDSGSYDISADPTKYLYLRFAFDKADAATQTIRELAIYTGTTLNDGVTAPYVIPSQIATQGQLLVIEYVAAIVRSDNIRQQFEFVIQF